MTATQQVTAICERLHLACRPAPRVQEADWQLWLENFKEPPILGRCPECGKPLRVKRGKFGEFVGCAGWPKCEYTASAP